MTTDQIIERVKELLKEYNQEPGRDLKLSFCDPYVALISNSQDDGGVEILVQNSTDEFWATLNRQLDALEADPDRHKPGPHEIIEAEFYGEINFRASFWG